mmetsp:Transcript_39381/g.47751  ORF Transcript_39381/g.47751 Transcript_39381/m.47751 type:complete len:262 (-) Transcript_39381:520-1305(-)|eukprot:CAMPEP_0197847850 /NCGR_PEP_ID=MMETSP1438-20131217/7274_1 /TAXON_ID=1461541 /ORGANISM="Pterosperma sp., Strain CCMP1384" /LENGTH=261 /DNA_ID=CAMNT_0043459893 /DNA_START=83 /DNA_END=868 /DNA_ORIENTATION=-
MAYTNADKEVVSKTLKVESKLFYFDLKENSRGRYLKISEKTQGTRSTVIVPANGISWFREVVKYFVDGSPDSKELTTESKVFTFDPGENARGGFLRIAEKGGAASRSLIIIPKGGETNVGYRDFYGVIDAIHNENLNLPAASGAEGAGVLMDGLSLDDNISNNSNTFFANGVVGAPGTANHGGQGMPNQMVRSGQKRFFFDVGSNARGSYLRITEVVGAGNDRSSVVVPTEVLDEFYGVLGTWVTEAHTRAANQPQGVITS